MSEYPFAMGLDELNEKKMNDPRFQTMSTRSRLGVIYDTSIEITIKN